MNEWISALLPSFLGAMLSALGMGGGGVLLIYLTAFQGMDQLSAQGINLVFFIPVAVISLIIHIRNRLIDRKLAFLIIPPGILGVFLGAKLANSLPDALLRRLFAGFLLIIGLRELWSVFHASGKDPEKKRSSHRKSA